METNGSSNTTTLSTANFEMTNYNNYPQLISGNSFELNTAASLSDDSGFAHSISSGSSRACRENENVRFLMDCCWKFQYSCKTGNSINS